MKNWKLEIGNWVFIAIVFSAIIPHSPLLLPSIGKENRDRLALTLGSLGQLRSRIAASKPDVLIIISPHGALLEKNFSLAIAPEYQASFEQFGDFETRLKFPGDVLLPTLVKQTLEITNLVTSIAETTIDHGVAIASHELNREHTIPIVPIGIGLLDYREHFEFGKSLAPILTQNERRIAVVASAEFSHRLGPLAPLGYSPHAATFDAHCIELITNGQWDAIPNIDPALAKETGGCGIAPIALLAGIIESLHPTAEILSYEAPFGIGYGTIDLKL